MDEARVIGIIILSAVITFSLRAFPFLIFRGKRRMPERLVYLGNILPAAIMAVLIVYCLKDVAGNFETYGVPQLTAVLVVAVSYKWKHNTFVSIILGTACNMILMQVLSSV